MAEREVLLIECDGCGSDQGLAVETAKFGRKQAREVDVCPACDAKYLAPARELFAKGRRAGTGLASTKYAAGPSVVAASD